MGRKAGAKTNRPFLFNVFKVLLRYNMLTIFLIFGLILVLAAFVAWPEISLYALAFFLPLTGWAIFFHGFVAPFVDLIAVVALAAFVIRLTYQLLFKKGTAIKLKWPLFLPFAVFIFINFLASLFSAQVPMSLWYIARWLLLLYFAYIFLPYNLITNGKILKRTIIALVLSSLLVLASGYLSLYGQDWRDSFFRLKSLAVFGVFPFGENQNLIAEFLNVGVFLILTIKELTKDERSKRILGLAFIFASLGLILTFSRSGWITLLLQLIIYFGYRLKNKVSRTTMILATLGLLLILSPLLWKMNQLQKENVSSTDNRWLLTTIAWQAFIDKPYLGYGSGQFTNLVASNIRFTAKYGAPLDSHGMLQKVAAETGLFGLAAWLFILIYLVRAGTKALKKYYHHNPWLLPLLIAGGGGLFFQFFNTSYYQGKVWLPIIIGLAAIRLLENKYDRKSSVKN